ncbi:MAG: UDP-N-acetylmuramoyl-L-alanine--D-glutamate ligase [Candidatus Pacebacteria bacterium]|nr:UDP-N-acetylmuramoyl-L-alanine--D-glutamate ligase [Candidatus Paceibacterota bacterium]
MQINLDQYKGKNIHVVGIAGAEGSAIAEFLVAQGIGNIVGHDFSVDAAEFEKNFNNTHLSLNPAERKKALEHLRNLPIKINLRAGYLSGVEEADVVFVSQVWFKYPVNAPLKPLYEKGVKFKTITNLYFEFAPCPIISVTGTNGKTTTSNLIKSIFVLWEKENPDRKFYFAGNDRQNIQVLDKLEGMKENDVFLLETSSTQLVLNSGISPHIGIITNITPNHLDDHGTFENYIKAKESMIDYQDEGDFAVLSADDEVTRKIAGRHKKNAFLFSIGRDLEEGCFMEGDKAIIRKSGNKELLFEKSDLKIFGDHNLKNALAASSAAYLFGASTAVIRAGVSSYAGIRHRLKLIYNIEGINYFDDTQATTPEATVAGLNSFSRETVLVAGGDDKGMDYTELGKVINSKVKALMLFPGSASDMIEKAVNKDKLLFEKVETFQDAIKLLKKYFTEGILKDQSTVLISPAAAHFYSKFVESSGKDLKEWIKEMKD